MMPSFRSTRWATLLALSVLTLGACTKDEHDHEVDVDFMRITVGAQQVMVNSTGAVTGGPINLVRGVSTSITVAFLNAAMADALDDHADDFQVNVTTPSGVTFTRTGPFTGTLSASAAGTYSVGFSLYHLEENHEDFGPFTVPVAVTTPPAPSVVAN
jgi:hypothetical protein